MLSSRYLHVYYLDLPRFLGQGFQALSPPKLEVQPWMWMSSRVTLDLAPGTYQLSRTGVNVGNATLRGNLIVVAGPALTVPVTLYSSGDLTLTRLT